MQVFKTYFKILNKQRVPILIYSIMFLALTIAISTSIKVENTTFEASKVDIMVVNEDGENELLNGLLDYMSQYANFVEPEKDEEARKDALFYHKVEYILTIPEGFTDRFLSDGAIQLSKTTIPNSVEAMSIDNALNNYLNMAKVYAEYIPDINYETLNQYVADNLKEETQVTMNIQEEDAVAYSNGFNMNYFNYLGYIMISSVMIGVSIVMLSFQDLNIRRRHSAAPLTSRNMNMQLLLGNLVYVAGYLLIFVVAGYVLNRERMINGNTLLTWLNAAIFALTSLSISYLVGIAVKNRKAVSAISTALSLSLAFISGIFVPQQFLGASVLRAASFTPTFWFVKANNAIASVTSMSWNNISSIIGYMAIQAGFAAAIISIALVVSKRKRQQAS